MNFAEYLQKIQADCVSLSYGMLRPGDIEQIHSAGIAMALIEYWNQHSDIFRQYDIDLYSVGNPINGRKNLEQL